MIEGGLTQLPRVKSKLHMNPTRFPNIDQRTRENGNSPLELHAVFSLCSPHFDFKMTIFPQFHCRSIVFVCFFY